MIQIQKEMPRQRQGQSRVNCVFDYSNKQAMPSIHPVTTIDEDKKGVIDNALRLIHCVQNGSDCRIAKAFAYNTRVLLDRIELKRGEK